MGYVGGVANVDPDVMSYFEILDHLKELHLSVTTFIWNKTPT